MTNPTAVDTAPASASASASASRLKIGISACFMYPDPQRRSYAPKTLQYLEQSVPHWLMGGGAMPVMVPSGVGEIGPADYAEWLDGLVLHGGADLWPGSYGESPLQPEWSGDRLRDEYEIALVHAFAAAGKPVFGICRGLQLVNVAYGGTLYQDLPTQRPGPAPHRNHETFDIHYHHVVMEDNSWLSAMYTDADSYKINSIHHQGIKDLAPGFRVQARCLEDGNIEAIRRDGASYVVAVQWHPEFHTPEQGVIDDTPLLQDFLRAARARRSA